MVLTFLPSYSTSEETIYTGTTVIIYFEQSKKVKYKNGYASYKCDHFISKWSFLKGKRNFMYNKIDRWMTEGSNPQKVKILGKNNE